MSNYLGDSEKSSYLARIFSKNTWREPKKEKYTLNIPVFRQENLDHLNLWQNGWIANNDLKNALRVSKIVVESPSDIEEVVQPEEVELFKQNAWAY